MKLTLRSVVQEIMKEHPLEKEIDPTLPVPGVDGNGLFRKKDPHNIDGQDWSHNPAHKEYDPHPLDTLANALPVGTPPVNFGNGGRNPNYLDKGLG